ncbi:S41 family peptidase [Roseateles albus]|uniref:S41 family peptidase n=1 Tax=Roseateles albus TaxID=2987525 RepID=A0ABT5KF49_9BURK|nr:S41 family peptidase [Roseateles albus]MDC8771451.1 S41 family peptidase [Roseateles albus]
MTGRPSFSTNLCAVLGAPIWAVLALSLAGQAEAVEAAELAKPSPPKTAAAWQRAAVQDINTAYRITLDNHPGAQDPANPGFKKNLAQARRQGLALAAKVGNSAGYVAAMQRFNVGIHDGHAGVFTTLDEKSVAPPERWPGFVTVWRGDALYVYAAQAGGPAVGARVLSCDGLAIKDLITRNVFAFNGRSDEAGHWWVRARRVFVDAGNPFISLPKRCQFDAGAGSKRFTQTLVWQAANEQSRQWIKESYNGDALEVGLTEPRPGLFWAAMPTFQPDESQRAAYQAINKQVGEQRQSFLDADALVIDLRHNQGGSSTWSRDFAAVLWGAETVERRMSAYQGDMAIWWRASVDNTAYLGELVERLTKEGQAETAAWVKTICTGMQAALARGDKFFIEPSENEVDSQPASSVASAAHIASDPAADLPADSPAYTKPVYVVVPGQCASACLDALDIFTRFPNTRLIGAPSSADSTYMEVRTQALASGLATVIIPNKVYVKRPRANGQIYVPDIVLKELRWSTANVAKAVEADLAAKRP